ncbi:hypothetical protein NC797_07140 [Aquibacillus sp. 3ASR75-11]|uniref:Uncharacterized protein n=1 Tax=Terrihalobacillus insolitus TaxID=2950438 RepID=A0A9X4ALD9_9BACI|nr:hypothetical protein [Terrihalobacillus insolitus]MDC3424282.1 hypothetical protein [Terrihalobacillus insolitus]
MEIDIYEKTSLEHSISNLAMLKTFHDVGVNVKQFAVKTFMVDINYQMDVSLDIFHQGAKQLFRDVEWYDTDIEYEDSYRELFENEGAPEYTLIMKDPILEKVLNSKLGEQFNEFVDRVSHQDNYTEATFDVLPANNGIASLVWFPGMLHELASSLVEVKKKAIELINKLESEPDGIPNQDNRQIA